MKSRPLQPFGIGTSVCRGVDIYTSICEQTAHLLAALHSEGIEAPAAQLQHLVALGVAQLLPAHQVVGAPLIAGDAVEGEPCPPSA
jgi:hypothetical protein